MATPQRRPDPNQNPAPPTLENLPAVEKQVGRGRPFAWWWIWIPLAVAAFWYAGWGWGSYGGWWWGHSSASAVHSARYATPAQPVTNTSGNQNGAAATGTAISGSGVAVLDASNKQTFAGQSFEISNVPVQGRAGNQAIWIGTSNANNAPPMLLVLPSGQNTPNLRAGDTVDARGTIEKAPPAAKAAHQWSLSGLGEQRLQQEGVYIQANQVQIGRS